MLTMSNFPSVFRVRQNFQRPLVEDVAGEVRRQLEGLSLGGSIQHGQSVAITAGSRGIANIHSVIKAAAEQLKRWGAEPFIVPAMGSHGGGTAEGQQKILESYGITESYCGCPIRSSMETVVVCHAEEGFEVHFDRLAYEADHVLVCGRVKPHTNFVGDIESGLMKMLLIGLGKHNGAYVYHRAIQDFSFDQIIRSVAREVLGKCNILAGLAVVENAFDETALIEAVPPDQFEERERRLLRTAKEWMPRLPFGQMDVLMLDEIGKNISGSGMDTNVAGRKLKGAAATDEYAQPRWILVRRLTPETHGNACGIGFADFTTKQVMDQLDQESTWINCLTAAHPAAGKLPVFRNNDRETLQTALSQIGLTAPQDARLTWVQNTLKVIEAELSVAYLDEARRREDLEILCDPRPLPFDPEGNLCGVAKWNGRAS